jgi:putative membrane protein
MAVRPEDALCGTMSRVTKRQPTWVYDAGEEPDPRFSLANERTFLAWVRTALAMLAGGVALHALAVPSTDWLRTLLVVLLIGVGGLVSLFSLVRWARIERAIRLREPMPAFGLGIVTAGALLLVAILLVVVLV